jgi:hypothetical protein
VTTKYIGSLTLALAALTFVDSASAQKKPSEKDRPQLILADPFTLKPGSSNIVKLHGIKLDSITDVRCHDPKSTAKLRGKPTKSAPPDAKLLPLVGDSNVEIELILPKEVPGNELTLSVTGPDGDSDSIRLLVNDEKRMIEEKEPNNGFRYAQELVADAVIDGKIQSNQDVDVFCFDGQAGRRFRCEVISRRYGSPLDPIITLFDGAGNIVRASDESPRNASTSLSTVLPRDGTYYVVIQDAHDLGSALHRYRLQFQLDETKKPR